MIIKISMMMTMIAIAGIFTSLRAQGKGCNFNRNIERIFTETLCRLPTDSEALFWFEKSKGDEYEKKNTKSEDGLWCYLSVGGEKKFISSIMDWAIADPPKPTGPRLQTTEVWRMVDRAFQKATGKPASQQEHATWDNIVRNQKTTCSEIFSLIAPDLVIKEVADIPNDIKSVNVYIVNQGKSSTPTGSVLRLIINNTASCNAGDFSKEAEFSIPVLQAGKGTWVKVTSTDRLGSGGERMAYLLIADAKRTVAESNEGNNGKCMPGYIIK